MQLLDPLKSPETVAVSPQPSKLRVAYFTKSFTMGGVERSTTLIIKHLDRNLYEPILVCSDEPAITPMAEEVETSGAEVIRTPLLSVFPKEHALVRLRAMIELLASLKIDILHIQVLGGTGGKLAALAAKMAGVPVVIVTIRGAILDPLPTLKQRASRLLDRSVNRYTTATEQNRQLQILNAGRQTDKVQTIYNAIDVAPFAAPISASEARASLGLPANGPIIGTIGRLDPQKGPEYFLEMASIVHKQRPDAHFVLVGDGERRPEYEALARKYGVEKCVTFAGYRADVNRCLAAMDVFVLASTFEPFGLVLAEALMAKRAVVATNVGGIPEVVQDGITGTIVEARNAAALASAALNYLQHPQLAAEHGNAGREDVLARFSEDRLMTDLHNLYQREWHGRRSIGSLANFDRAVVTIYDSLSICR